MTSPPSPPVPGPSSDAAVAAPGQSATSPFDRATLQGAALAVGAYFSWGIVPIYWHRVGAIPPIEVLSYRVVGSVVFLALLLTVRRAWPTVRAALSRGATVRTLTVTTILIGANWGLFIWAVQAHRLLEASFGYYINPLVNVSLGVWMLGERLRRAQLIAVGFALAGVAVLTLGTGAMPWVSLALAATFAVYGLMRKTAQVDALVGLFIETLLIAPAAFLYLFWLARHGALALAHVDAATQRWVSLVGVITAVPLLWFTGAARRLRLSTLGFFQYVAPTCQMLIAIASGEALGAKRLVAFGLIWAAIAIYSAESIVVARR